MGQDSFLRRVRPRAALRFAPALLASTVLAGLPALPAIAQNRTTAQEEQQQDGRAEAQLPEIVVEGSSYETEGTGSYTTDLISVGEKDVRPLREIPQSTTVLTRERLEDGNFTSLDTALRKTPGVVVLNNDDGRSSIASRGFEFDTLYFNGLPAPLSSIYGTQPDMAIIDHIEILRGPAGLFAGTGEPAGAVNMRLKQASDEFNARFTASVGSWENRRGELDVTGALNADGSIRGRFVSALQGQESWVDEVDNGVGVAYGTIAADITDNTTLTLSLSHMERDITPFNGLPTLADGTLLDLDRSTFTGADWNDFNNSVTDYIAELEHRFDDGGHVKVSARYSDRDVDFLYGYAGAAAAPNGDVASMAWLSQDYAETSLALDAHISKPFELLGFEQNIILGADYRDVDSTKYEARGSYTPSTPFNLDDWNTDVPEPSVNYTSKLDTDPNQFGLYGQWRVKPIDQLTLIGGGRLSWYDATATTTTLSSGATTATDTTVDAEVTPYAGVIYDLTQWASLYGSYTQIFQPQSELGVDGDIIDPRTGRQYEVGLKGEFFEGGLNASIAYFNLRDKNRAFRIGNSGPYYPQGEAEAQGIEIEATGTILPGWEVAGGYTYTTTELEDATNAYMLATPEHMLQLWTKYTFDEGSRLEGFYIGGGLKVYSDFYAQSGATRIDADGYAVVDLLAGYKFNDHVTASLAVNNVFDEKYYARVGGPTVFNFYGEPRSAILKLTTSF